MSPRPFCLSIAGFDPSGGAGILADIKSFEQSGAYGLGVLTSNTIQTETKFVRILWENSTQIADQLSVMLESYPISSIKIGIIENLERVDTLITQINNHSSEIAIIWDPIIKSSTGFRFLQEMDVQILHQVLAKILMITPNTYEACSLGRSEDILETCASLSDHCHVLLKGGHRNEALGVDLLFRKEKEIMTFQPKSSAYTAKHGSGCVLSASICANLALGLDLIDAIKQAKIYSEAFLSSNQNRLGYHSV